MKLNYNYNLETIVGTKYDESTYLSLYISKLESVQIHSIDKGVILCEVESKNKQKFMIVLKGRVNVYKPDGKTITTPSEYQKYIDKNEHNTFLHSDTSSYVDIISTNNFKNNDGYYGVFYSIQDALNAIENFETKNELVLSESDFE